MMKKFERKTVYIYEINGKEMVKVTDAEEALYWDGVFEVAEQVDELLRPDSKELKLDEDQRIELSLYLAKNKDKLLPLLAEGASEEVVDKGARKPQTSETKAEPSTQSAEQKQSDKVKKQSFVQEFNRPVEPSKDGFSL